MTGRIIYSFMYANHKHDILMVKSPAFLELNSINPTNMRKGSSISIKSAFNLRIQNFSIFLLRLNLNSFQCNAMQEFFQLFI